MIKTNRRNVGKNQLIYSHHTNRKRAGEHFRACWILANQRARNYQIIKHFILSSIRYH